MVALSHRLASNKPRFPPSPVGSAYDYCRGVVVGVAVGAGADMFSLTCVFLSTVGQTRTATRKASAITPAMNAPVDFDLSATVPNRGVGSLFGLFVCIAVSRREDARCQLGTLWGRSGQIQQLV
jgi:hypothetical protein